MWRIYSNPDPHGATPEYKMSLIDYLVNKWDQPAKRKKLQDKSLYVTCGEACYLVIKNQWTEIQTLKTIQVKRRLMHKCFMLDILKEMDKEQLCWS
jgi:hypothetical protein